MSESSNHGTAHRQQHRLWAACGHPSETFIPFTPAATAQSLPARFEYIARHYPYRLAVYTETHTCTYEALNTLANRVAHALMGQPGVPSAPIAVLMAPGAPLIAAMLGILKAAHICVPLDVSAPATRLQDLLTDTQATRLVTDATYEAMASSVAPAACAVTSFTTLVAQGGETNPPVQIAPECPAYLIYTSGSSGRPKGVLKSHRQVLHEVRCLTNLFHLCADDRHMLLRAVSSNGAIQDIYSAVLNGATLFPFSLPQGGFAGLAACLQQHAITIYRSATTVFRHFFTALPGEAAFPSLRLIQVGGEPVTPQDVALYNRHGAPDCLFVNGFGLTETGPVCMYVLDHATPRHDALIPVGYAVEAMEYLLLDKTGNEVATGEVGEIVVASDVLALGYWHHAALTRATFQPDPRGGGIRRYRTGDMGRRLPDGCLEHLGRSDAQVKIRGNRVDTTEVEGALRALECVQEAVVIVGKTDSGEQRLVAYLVAATSPAPALSTLQRALQHTLPGYMIPAVFVFLEALPRTATGKIDRQALPPPGKNRPTLANALVAPRTPVEAELARLWATVLDLEQVGIHDHFLALGGHSLLASQITARVVQTFGIDLPAHALLEAPTIAAMATVIVQHQIEQVDQESIDRWLTEVEGMAEEDGTRHLHQDASAAGP